MKIKDLKTPAFLIDRKRIVRNIRAMSERAGSMGVSLRPHVKTHKTIEIARMQVKGHASGITVSTLAEARFFAQAGFDDITYAFPITPNKIDEAANLARKLESFHLLLDHADMARALVRYAEQHGTRFSVFLKIDPGYHRAGVDPKSEEAVSVATTLHQAEAVDFAGILTHGGHAYHASSPDGIRQAARDEQDALVRAARRLEKAGIPCPVISAGSTPTAVHGASWDGVNELRPGNYVFFDRFQASIGTCSLDDCAATVLATVAGVYPDRNELLIDAGALALSKDPGATQLSSDFGFGAVLGHDDLIVHSLSQEHGLIRSERPIRFDAFPLGTTIRIVPNHSCLAAALFPSYHLVDHDDLIDEWRPVRGW